MKLKNLVLGLSLLLSTVAIAQEKGDFNGFAGLSYPLVSGADIGATAGVEYVFAENFSAAPSFTYYFTSGVTNTQFDIDVRYYLGDESFNWFLTGGLVINSASASGISVSDTGFNGGAGALFSLSDSLDLVATAKYNSNLEGVVPMVGVTFGF